MENLTSESLNQTPHTHHTGFPRMAGFWRRFGAHFIDGLIISLVSSPFGSGYNFQFTGKIESVEDFERMFTALGPSLVLGNVLSWIVYLAVALAYFGWFYSKKGQTPGKMLFKLKVVKPDLKYLDWQEAFIRDGLMKLVSGALLGLGYFWYFANPKRQTWHDSVVHSYVVQTDAEGNILMDGQQTYPVSKLKAFGFPCGCCLLWVVMIFGVIMAIAALAPGVRKAGENNPALREAAREYKRVQEQNETQTDEFLDSLAGEADEESTPMWTEEEMEEMNQQQMENLQKMNQQQMEMLNRQMQMQMEMDSRETQNN